MKWFLIIILALIALMLFSPVMRPRPAPSCPYAGTGMCGCQARRRMQAESARADHLLSRF